MDKIKICFVHFRKPAGGTYSTLLNQIKLFNESKKIRVFYIGRTCPKMDNIFKHNPEDYLKVCYEDNTFYRFFNFKFISKIRKFVIKNGFDYIYIFGIARDLKALYVPLIGLKLKVVFRIDAYVSRKRKNLIDKFFLNRIDIWVTVCESIKENILNFYPIAGRDKIYLLYNFIDTEYFSKNADIIDKTKKDYLIPDNKLIIGHGARILETKGQLEALQSFNLLAGKYPGIFLLLWGPVDDENYFQILNKYITDNNLSDVKIIKGNVDSKILLNITDIFIFPTHDETISMSVLEAMSFGLPVICSEVGGMKECIENNKNGFLAEKQNIREFAELLEKLIIDKELREQIGLNARKTIVGKFSKESLSGTYINLFK